MKILSMKYLKYNSLKIISIIVSFSLVMTSVHPLCAKGLFLAVPGSSELLSHGFKEELVVEELSFKKVTLGRNQLIAITAENNIELTLSKKPGNKWVLGIITEEKEVEQIQKIKTTILEKLLRHENRAIQQFVMQAKQGMLERRFLSILEELAEEKEPERIVSLTGEILTILVDNRNIKPTKDQFNILIEILVSHKEPYDRYGIAKELTNAIGMTVANNRILFNDLFEKIISLPDNSPELECFLMAELYSLIFIEGTSRHPGKQRLQINVDKFSKLITKFSYQKESGILSWFSRIIIRILEHNPSLNFSQEQFNILLNKFSSETDTMTMEKFPTLLTMATERNPEFFNSFKEQLDKFIAPDKGRTVDVKIEEEYAEELSLFFNLLHNRDELKKLLFFLSILRIIYPDDISNDSALAPLEFAKKNGIIFTYNNFIKVCPVTESFRRHILIIKGKSGKEHLVEIKIPGQAEGRDLIQPTHFTLARKAHNKYKQKNRVAKPVGMASAFGRFRLYNEILGYTRDEYPLRVVIFEYQDGKRLGRHVNRVLKLVNIDYLKRVADNKGITLDELYIDITNQLRFIGKQLLDLGYAGRVRVGRILFNDFHIENFRLLPDGKVIAVGDFGAFERKHLTELQKKRQIGQLIKPWVQGYEAPSRELTKLFRALKNESDTNKANRIGLQVTGMFCNTDLIITKKQIKIILERIRTVPMSGSHYKYDPLNYKLIKELLILIGTGFKGNYNLLKILRDEPDKKFRVFLEKVNDEMGFDLFKKPLPMGSPYKMYEFLRNKRKYVSDKEISDETGLSIKYTIEPDLRTLYFLGLVRKEFREEEIVYQAISINKTEWEEIVEPILADLGSHPGKKEKEDAKNELIKTDIERMKESALNQKEWLVKIQQQSFFPVYLQDNVVLFKKKFQGIVTHADTLLNVHAFLDDQLRIQRNIHTSK